MSENVLILLISFFLATGTSIVGYLVNHRQTLAAAKASRSDAAESLSNAAAKQIETYQHEIVDPLNKRIETLTAQLSVIEQDRDIERQGFRKDISTLSGKVEKLTHQIDFMKGELRRADTALEYLVGVTQVSHPVETEQAVKIRRGQVKDDRSGE